MTNGTGFSILFPNTAGAGDNWAIVWDEVSETWKAEDWVQKSSHSTNFWGSISATNIPNDTINSNKLDAATRSMLGSGSGSDPLTVGIIRVRTNRVDEGVFTNGVTIGGVRRTDWPAAGSNPAFSEITAGTSTDDAFVIGNGSSLAATGTGTITATAYGGTLTKAQVTNAVSDIVLEADNNVFSGTSNRFSGDIGVGGTAYFADIEGTTLTVDSIVGTLTNSILTPSGGYGSFGAITNRGLTSAKAVATDSGGKMIAATDGTGLTSLLTSALTNGLPPILTNAISGQVITSAGVSGGTITNTGLTSAKVLATDSNGKLITATDGTGLTSLLTSAVTNALPAITTNAVDTTGDIETKAVRYDIVNSGVTTGDGTATWDLSKSTYCYLATNAAITLSLSGPSAGKAIPSVLVVSNSAASGTIKITFSGFSVLTNGIPCSEILVTNYAAKRQVTIFSLLAFDTGRTNGTATHFYEP
jgi:hypothetical protein